MDTYRRWRMSNLMLWLWPDFGALKRLESECIKRGNGHTGLSGYSNSSIYSDASSNSNPEANLYTSATWHWRSHGTRP
jgi:hypothetical protein